MPEPSASSLPKFDELFVVSDLHLGGEPGFQIFKENARLGRFFEALAAHEPKRRVALVLAGDILDSLPFLPAGTYLAPDPARLVRDIAKLFAPVFDGLRRFVGKPRRELWVLTGNHDIELALPEGQDALLDALCGGSEAARGRVRFRVGGTGLRCRVGGRTVLVTHGNEADRWNQVDYESLRQVAHARALGVADAQALFSPNPGTRLVVDAMNTIKRKHPFVDLLKPENEACLKLLLALYPLELLGLLPTGAMTWTSQRLNPSFVLGAEGERAPALDPLAEALARLRRAPQQEAADIEERVQQAQAADTDPLALVSDDDATLGLPGYLVDRALGVSRTQALRAALLDWVGDEHHWRFDQRDEVCREVLERVGPGVDAVVTGHTHLARHFVEPARRLVYANTGTWARLIRLGARDLTQAADEQIQTLVQALESGDMATLDAATFGGTGALAQTRSHAARVTPERAELLLVTDAGSWTVEHDEDGGALSTPFASLV